MQSKSKFVLAALLALVATAVLPLPQAQARGQAQPQTQSANDDPLSPANVLRDPSIPVMGNPKGNITIVEYFDYQCPYCKKMNPMLERIVHEDGHIRLVFKDWPIFGKVSVYAARLALATKYQHKYREAHQALISRTEKLTDADVRATLAQHGIDLALAERDLANHGKAIDALLARNRIQAIALGFQGTPAFIVGHFRIPGAIDEANFKLAIADARAAEKAKKDKHK